MKFEQLNSSKFKSFESSKLAFSHAVYGGYPGETSTGSQSDQIKSSGSIDYTDNPSGVRNDGFSRAAGGSGYSFGRIGS